MMRYSKHIFVCVNQRDLEDARGCCANKGSEAIRERFKTSLKKHQLAGDVRANASGCLDACEFGPVVVVYPDAVWYGGVTPEDVEEIIESHIINDIPVERLLIRNRRYTPEPLRAASDDSTPSGDTPTGSAP